MKCYEIYVISQQNLKIKIKLENILHREQVINLSATKQEHHTSVMTDVFFNTRNTFSKIMCKNVKHLLH